MRWVDKEGRCMKKTREERRAFLDKIEKKYNEKLQLLSYKQESEQLAQQLRAVRGKSVDELDRDEISLFEFPDYRLTIS